MKKKQTSRTSAPCPLASKGKMQERKDDALEGEHLTREQADAIRREEEQLTRDRLKRLRDEQAEWEKQNRLDAIRREKAV